MQTLYFGMSAAELIFKGALAIAAAVMLLYYLRSEKPLAAAFKGMAGGGAGLALLHFLGGELGLAVPLNFFTAFVSLSLGLPGAAALAAIEMLTK